MRKLILVLLIVLVATFAWAFDTVLTTPETQPDGNTKSFEIHMAKNSEGSWQITTQGTLKDDDGKVIRSETNIASPVVFFGGAENAVAFKTRVQAYFREIGWIGPADTIE